MGRNIVYKVITSIIGYINYSSNSVTVSLAILLPKDTIVKLTYSNLYRRVMRREENEIVKCTTKYIHNK